MLINRENIVFWQTKSLILYYWNKCTAVDLVGINISKKERDKLAGQDAFVFTHLLPSNVMLPGWIISLGAQKHNESNLHAFPLYFNIIISYSFKTMRPSWIINEIIFTDNSSCSWHVTVDSPRNETFNGYIMPHANLEITVANSDMRCPIEGAECSKATSRILKKPSFSEYSDWRQKIQKSISHTYFFCRSISEAKTWFDSYPENEWRVYRRNPFYILKINDFRYWNPLYS